MSATGVHAFPYPALNADAFAQVPPSHSRLVSVVPTLQVRKSSLSREVKRLTQVHKASKQWTEEVRLQSQFA